MERNYVDEVDPEALLEGALSGLFESLEDPHSVYLSELSLRDLNDTTSGRFGGVGMYISKEVNTEEENQRGKEEFIQIIAPIEDTPSARLGIRSNDLIIEIDSESTANLTIDDAVERLRGKVGTEVKIVIRRGTREFPIAITRAIIEVPTTRHALIDEHDIGYIRIIQFTPFTADRIEEALEDFESMGYEALIVDVRQNPGGLLSSVVDASDLFLRDGLIVGTSGRNRRENQVFNATKNTAISSTIPIVILIDEGSASASEIFAGALGDRDRAVIMGQKSFGKGSVQQIREAGNGAFRLTMSRYYTPDGTYIDKVGIVPDILAESEQFTEEQTDDITTLLAEGKIVSFVNNRARISQSEIGRFVAATVEETSLTSGTVERLVRMRFCVSITPC